MEVNNEIDSDNEIKSLLLKILKKLSDKSDKKVESDSKLKAPNMKLNDNYLLVPNIVCSHFQTAIFHYTNKFKYTSNIHNNRFLHSKQALAVKPANRNSVS